MVAGMIYPIDLDAEFLFTLDGDFVVFWCFTGGSPDLIWFSFLADEVSPFHVLLVHISGVAHACCLISAGLLCAVCCVLVLYLVLLTMLGESDPVMVDMP